MAFRAAVFVVGIRLSVRLCKIRVVRTLEA